MAGARGRFLHSRASSGGCGWRRPLGDLPPELEIRHDSSFDNKGKRLAGWPVLVEDSFTAAPALGDVDGDGHLEICLPSWKSGTIHLSIIRARDSRDGRCSWKIPSQPRQLWGMWMATATWRFASRAGNQARFIS